METWSYKILTCKQGHPVEEQLNQDGKEGWEAFQLDSVPYDGSTILYYRKKIS